MDYLTSSEVTHGYGREAKEQKAGYVLLTMFCKHSVQSYLCVLSNDCIT